jgi:hypothetical protein
LLRGPGPEGTGALGKGLQGGPKGPRKGPREVDAQERAWEGKGRLGLCLRKKKERRKKNQRIS